MIGGLGPVGDALAVPVCSAAVWAGDLAASWVAWVASWVSSWPAAAMAWPDGVIGFVSATGATAVLGFASWRLRRSPRWVRVAVASVAAVAAALGGPLGTALRGPVDKALGRSPPDGWLVAVCDVGQGTAVVVRSGDDSAVLIDAGPEGGGVDRCLDRLGVRRLDLVVLTHFHADHVGGLTAATAGRAWGELVHGTPCGEAAAADRAARIAEAAGAAVNVVGSEPEFGDGPVVGAAGEARLTVYPSSLARLCAASGPPGEDSVVNNAGLSVLAEVDGLSVWALGDLEAAGQDALLADLRASATTRGDEEAAPPGAGGVVVVAHHGSADQSAALAEALTPWLAVMSAGADNPYGHPTDEALALYGRFARVARTDHDGLTAVTAADLPS
jgi:competence protein ComEC